MSYGIKNDNLQKQITHCEEEEYPVVLMPPFITKMLAGPSALRGVALEAIPSDALRCDELPDEDVPVLPSVLPRVSVTAT